MSSALPERLRNSYGLAVTVKVKNVSQLTGVVSAEVNYENVNGEVIASGNPGAGNIRPGKIAKASDSQMAEKADSPGGEVLCDVVAAEVYVPSE